LTVVPMIGLFLSTAVLVWSADQTQTVAPEIPQSPALPEAGPSGSETGTPEMPEGAPPSDIPNSSNETPGPADFSPGPEEHAPSEAVQPDNSAAPGAAATGQTAAGNAVSNGAASTAQTPRRAGGSPTQQLKNALGRVPPSQQEMGTLSQRLGSFFDAQSARAGAALSAKGGPLGAGAAAVSGGFSTFKNGLLDVARVAETASAKYAPGLYFSVMNAASEAAKKDPSLAPMARSVKEIVQGVAAEQAPAALGSLGQDAVAAAFRGPDGQKEIDSVFESIGKWDRLLERDGHLLVNRRDLEKEIRRIQSQTPASLDDKSFLKRKALVKALLAAGEENVRVEKRGRNFTVVFARRAVLPLGRENLAADFDLKGIAMDNPLELSLEDFHSNPSVWNGTRLVFRYWHKKGHSWPISFWAALRYWFKTLRVSLL